MREYQNVRAEMARHDLTIKGLAQDIGLSTTALANRLRGHTPWGLIEALKVVDIFIERGSTVTVEDIFTGH